MAKRVSVVGRAKGQVISQLGRSGLTYDAKRPEIVIAFGGEGTFLYSEQAYPGVPKLLLYHSSACRGCRHDVSRYLRALRDGRYRTVGIFKIQGTVNGDPKKRLSGLNEINIHYKLPRALRFDLEVGGRKVARSVIGDGVVVSTPYGSTGYYSSITHKRFKKGMGIALNNPVKRMGPMNAGESAVVKVRITRGDGYMACDSLDRTFLLRTGDVVTVTKDGRARLVSILGKTKQIVKV